MLYKIIKIILILALLIQHSRSQALALDRYIYELPDPRTKKLWIADFANIINPKTENELNKILSEVNLKYRSEIVIVTIDDISPYQDSQQLAKYIFNIWHLSRIWFRSVALFLVSQGNHSGAIVADFMTNPSEPTIEDRKFQENVKNVSTEIQYYLDRDCFEEGIWMGTKRLVKLVRNKKFKYITKINFPNYINHNCK